MENVILFDDEVRDHLLPLTYTRPVCELRIGILTIREKWEHWLQARASFITQEYLSEKYPTLIQADNILINGGVLPSSQLVTLIREMGPNEALMDGEDLIAARLDDQQFGRLMQEQDLDEIVGYELRNTPYLRILRPWDIFRLNGEALEADFRLLTRGRESAPIPGSNRVTNNSNIFLEPDAKVENAILQASEYPIYIGKGAEIMDGCMVRGGLALGEGAVLKMGAKVYGPTTIGPHSKIGGEINNSVVQGFSNKGHDGFLGNSVIGEWCNLGAGTNNSNLKNNYAMVRIWNYPSRDYVPTGLQFCGLIMGDHSKCSINTMFNTGTVVGVFTNIFGGGFHPKFIPSFSWGGQNGWTTFQLDKSLEVAPRVMARRNVRFSENDQRILEAIFDSSQLYRNREPEDPGES